SDPGVRGEGEHAMRCVAAQPREATADNAHSANQQVDQPSYTAPAQDFGPYGKLDTSGARRSRRGRSHGHQAAGRRGLPRGVTLSGAVVRLPTGRGFLHATNVTAVPLNAWRSC